MCIGTGIDYTHGMVFVAIVGFWEASAKGGSELGYHILL